jgi:putative FmdB family regulatory protein
VPLYEYRCPICDDTFEARRPMAEASDPIECPQGHVGARRLLSVFASVGASSASSSGESTAPRPSGGGCCGGMCGC